jgi:hypothetical protein
MQQTLDIITVTRDDLEGVAATIRSTRRLRACPGIKQIIIDGSSELEKRKVQELLTGEMNIDYIWHEPCGIAHAFNEGISSSNAEWLWFLNGRDEAHHDLNALFLLQILNASQAGIIIFNLQLMQSGTLFKHPPIWALWPPMYWIPHPATILRRDLMLKHGKFSREYAIAMDGELWVRLLSKDIGVNILSMPIALYDQSGVSSTDTEKVMREIDKIIRSNFFLLFKLWFTQGLYLFRALKRYSRAKFGLH